MLLSERGVGLSAHVADFERMYHALAVSQIADVVVFGVEQLQLPAERFETFALKTGFQKAARLFINGGDVVNTVAYGINVEH